MLSTNQMYLGNPELAEFERDLVGIEDPAEDFRPELEKKDSFLTDHKNNVRRAVKKQLETQFEDDSIASVCTATDDVLHDLLDSNSSKNSVENATGKSHKLPDIHGIDHREMVRVHVLQKRLAHMHESLVEDDQHAKRAIQVTVSRLRQMERQVREQVNSADETAVCKRIAQIKQLHEMNSSLLFQKTQVQQAQEMSSNVKCHAKKLQEYLDHLVMRPTPPTILKRYSCSSFLNSQRKHIVRAAKLKLEKQYELFLRQAELEASQRHRRIQIYDKWLERSKNHAIRCQGQRAQLVWPS